MNDPKSLYELSNPDGTPWEQLGMQRVKLWQQWADRVKDADPQMVKMDEGPLIQARLLTQAGFMGKINMVMVVDHQLLGKDWGGPDPDVLADPGLGAILLIFPASHHHKNEPEYDETGLMVTLSFDRVYRVKVPWNSIHRISFDPVPPQNPEAA